MKVELADHFDTFSGKGVSAFILGEEVLVGNRTLLQEKGVQIPPEIEPRITAFEQEGKTAVLVAAGGQMAGVIAIADTLKGTTKDAVEYLI
jgi:Cu+-exporting ATPase